MSNVSEFLKKFSKRKIGVVGAGIIIFFILLAILAPVLPISPPHSTSLSSMNLSPSLKYPFGTNEIGENVLSLTIWGSRISLEVGFAAAAVVLLLGLTIGIIAGYVGGIFDEILMRLTDFVLVLPSLVLIIVIGALYGTSLLNVILIIGFVSWPRTARIVRSMTLSIRERQFVEAARSVNGSPLYIMFRHVFPNVASVVIATGILSVSTAIFTQAAMVFLGVGNVTSISWGQQIEMAFTTGGVIDGFWWTSFFPGLFLVLLIVGFVFLSIPLEEMFNPKMEENR
ncbi:MAG: ABC transporter permease [Thermoplasmatales archaeon]|jgi:peptide/nickel transport system permease protein|nr:ABC transporter permease [Thermoplasmatales archaeon]